MTVPWERLSQRGAKTPSLLERAERMGEGSQLYLPASHTNPSTHSLPPPPAPAPQSPEEALTVPALTPRRGRRGRSATPLSGREGRSSAPRGEGKGEGGRRERSRGRKAREEGCGERWRAQEISGGRMIRPDRGR